MNSFLHREYYWRKREWPNKNVKPRIIAEEYLDSLGKPDSVEYKLTCMTGVVKIVTVCQGIPHAEFDKRTNDNYDRDLNHLPWWAFYKNAKKPVPIPPEIHKIIEYAELRSSGIPQVRVDFYLHNGIIYFGEFTFFTWAEFIKYEPLEWDDIMGQWCELPEKYNEE